MATIQTDGATNVTNTSTKNDAGVMRHAGNINATQGAPGFTSKSLGDGRADLGGSIVASGNDTTTIYNNSSVTSFNMNRGAAQVQLVGQVNYDAATSNRNGFTLAGETHTVLRGGASDTGDRTGFHRIETVRTTATATAIREGRWVAFSGAFRNEGAVASTDGLWDNAANAAGGVDDDHAAKRSLGRPDQAGGEITMHHGRLGNPTNSNDNANFVYKAKHGTTS